MVPIAPVGASATREFASRIRATEILSASIQAPASSVAAPDLLEVRAATTRLRRTRQDPLRSLPVRPEFATVRTASLTSVRATKIATTILNARKISADPAGHAGTPTWKMARAVGSKTVSRAKVESASATIVGVPAIRGRLKMRAASNVTLSARVGEPGMKRRPIAKRPGDI